ncbi:hypothetical protein PR048_002380 [Dryococelus australis]|uniref:Uncharacterized protein n=1 Tax=Dryococelus australis TaxID=614101 RepID=A0ABQ9IK21_9NEOP|nr:hypothetical protein PR048_002380 [Dryococelus australis]
MVGVDGRIAQLPGMWVAPILLTSHLGEPGSIPGGVDPGFSHVRIVPDYATGRRVFSGIFRFPALAYTPHFTLIGSLDLDDKSRQNLSTPLLLDKPRNRLGEGSGAASREAEPQAKGEEEPMQSQSPVVNSDELSTYVIPSLRLRTLCTFDLKHYNIQYTTHAACRQTTTLYGVAAALGPARDYVTDLAYVTGRAARSYQLTFPLRARQLARAVAASAWNAIDLAAFSPSTPPPLHPTRHYPNPFHRGKLPPRCGRDISLCNHRCGVGNTRDMRSGSYAAKCRSQHSVRNTPGCWRSHDSRDAAAVWMLVAISSNIYYKTITLQRHDGNTARLARRSDEVLGVPVSIARIAPSLLELGRSGSHGGLQESASNREWIISKHDLECNTSPPRLSKREWPTTLGVYGVLRNVQFPNANTAENAQLSGGHFSQYFFFSRVQAAVSIFMNVIFSRYLLISAGEHSRPLPAADSARFLDSGEHLQWPLRGLRRWNSPIARDLRVHLYVCGAPVKKAGEREKRAAARETTYFFLFHFPPLLPLPTTTFLLYIGKKSKGWEAIIPHGNLHTEPENRDNCTFAFHSVEACATPHQAADRDPENSAMISPSPARHWDDPRGNPASKVKKQGSDTGDTTMHAYCLISPTRIACSVSGVTLYCANYICNVGVLLHAIYEYTRKQVFHKKCGAHPTLNGVTNGRPLCLLTDISGLSASSHQVPGDVRPPCDVFCDKSTVARPYWLVCRLADADWRTAFQHFAGQLRHFAGQYKVLVTPMTLIKAAYTSAGCKSKQRLRVNLAIFSGTGLSLTYCFVIFSRPDHRRNFLSGVRHAVRTGAAIWRANTVLGQCCLLDSITSTHNTFLHVLWSYWNIYIDSALEVTPKKNAQLVKDMRPSRPLNWSSTTNPPTRIFLVQHTSCMYGIMCWSSIVLLPHYHVTGMTPLMYAVKDNRTSFLDRMIELGADVCARNNSRLPGFVTQVTMIWDTGDRDVRPWVRVMPYACSFRHLGRLSPAYDCHIGRCKRSPCCDVTRPPYSIPVPSFPQRTDPVHWYNKIVRSGKISSPTTVSLATYTPFARACLDQSRLGSRLGEWIFRAGNFLRSSKMRKEGETGDPRENSPTSGGIARHDFRMRKSGSGFTGNLTGHAVFASRIGLVLAEKQFNVGTQSLVVRSQRDRSIPGRVTPGFSHLRIVPDDASGWRIFLGISRFLTL